MGLMDKIEQKLGGSDKNDEYQKYDNQGTTTTTAGQGSHLTGSTGQSSSPLTDTRNPGASTATTGGTASHLQHPISSSTGTGSGITGGTAVTGAGAGAGSGLTGTHGSSNLTGTHGSSNLTGTHGTSGLTGTHGSNDYARDGNISSTSDKLRDTHLGSNTSNTGYGASQGRYEAGDVGSRRNVDDPEVHRLPGGGISNSSNATNLTTGPHSQLENKHAIPTAGGHKVGGVGEDSYGRNTTGTGYDSRDNYGPGPAPNTAGPHKSDTLNKLDPRVTADPAKHDARDTTYGSTGNTSSTSRDQPLSQSSDFNSRHHTGSALGAGAVGAGAGAGALASDRSHTGHHNTSSTSATGLGHNTSSSSTTGGIDHHTQGSEWARRMGGAYESGYRDGYRDAMAHKAPQV